AAVAAWSYVKRAALSLGILFVINSVLILAVAGRAPERTGALPGYLIWAAVDLVSVLFAWVVVRTIDGPDQGVPASTA
ncbi:hypothetical protein ABTL45_19470, partial [Acinetobacter baumannii]